MSNIFSKLKDFLGGPESSESEEYDYQEEEIVDDHDKNRYQQQEDKLEEEQEQESFPRRRYRESSNLTGVTSMDNTRSNVIGLPGINPSVSEVVVFEPHSFEEMPKVIQALQQRRSVVLNLNVMDPDEAQRAVDFVAGGTYAIDGHQERIGESIFLFTPNTVKVSTVTGALSEIENELLSNPVSPIMPNNPWGSETTRLA